MTLVEDRLTRRSVSDGLDAVRLLVLLSLVVDVVSSLIASSYGVAGLGRTGAVASLQSLIIVVAVAACLWCRVRTAVALTVSAAVLVFITGPSGTEPWLIVVTGVAIAVRARRFMIGIGAAAHLTYGVAFALDVERRHPGWGWSAVWTALAFSAFSFALGLTARRLLRARDERRARVVALQQENAQIRATERRRLADDLQIAVIRGLAEMDEVIGVARRSGDTRVLRPALTEVDRMSRSLAGELRALLDVLRSDLERPAASSIRSRAGRHIRWSTGRKIQIALSAGCVLLAVRALLSGTGVFASGAGAATSAVAVETIGFLACAVALFHPAAGMLCAVAALVVAAVFDAPGSWDVVPAALLSLVATLRLGPKGLWTVSSGLIAYAGLVIVTGAFDPFWRLTTVGYAAVLASTAGLVARHLLRVRRELRRDVLDLMNERQRLESEERGAVARELHDVVAHQLSVSTLLVLGTSTSEDPRVLVETLDKVGRSTEAARQELDVLLRAMRGPLTDQAQPSPLVTSRANVESLVERLTEHGYQPVVDIDPAADSLDATTLRTLGRILQESTTNILRYAPRGSVCRYTLVVDDHRVSLDVVSPYEPAGRASDLSSGWGLRGIRERVELVHGAFRAHQADGSWTVSVSLPLIVERLEPIAALG